MELYRQMNPDWRFADPTTFLLAEIAEIESERRYMEVQRLLGAQEDGTPVPVPKRYWPAQYGPTKPDSDDESDAGEDRANERDDEARAVAAEMLAEMGFA